MKLALAIVFVLVALVVWAADAVLTTRGGTTTTVSYDSVPQGIVVLWPGPTNAIPPGWRLYPTVEKKLLDLGLPLIVKQP